LVTFMETGRMEPDLEGYLAAVEAVDRQALRNVLNQSVPVNAVMALNFLDSAMGQLASLHQLVKVIAQPATVA
jgi:hypothetical protein